MRGRMVGMDDRKLRIAWSVFWGAIAVFYCGQWVRESYQSEGVGIDMMLTVVLSPVLAAGPWIRDFNWRFSLRTLLIAMTLVAVGLGLIVYSMGK